MPNILGSTTKINNKKISFVMLGQISQVRQGMDTGDNKSYLYKKLNATTNTWTTTVLISTQSTANSGSSELIVDNDNNIHVTWTDSTDYLGSGVDGDIFYKGSE